MTTKPLTANEIYLKAGLGQQIHKLADIVFKCRPEDIKGVLVQYEPVHVHLLAKQLDGIKEVLWILELTPGASLNRKALAVLEKQVRQAEQLIADEYVQELLAPHTKKVDFAELLDS